MSRSTETPSRRRVLLEEGGFIIGDSADGKRVFTITAAGRELLTRKPADTSLDDADEGVDLRGTAMKLGAAVMQAARASDDASQQKVRAILDNASPRNLQDPGRKRLTLSARENA